MTLAPRPASPGTNVPSRNRSAPLRVVEPVQSTGTTAYADEPLTRPVSRPHACRPMPVPCHPEGPVVRVKRHERGFPRGDGDIAGSAAQRRAASTSSTSRELPRLVALARGLCGAAIAEDVAQEAMLVAYRRWREVGDLERPDLWVRRTCANLAVSQFRRKVVELRATARLGARRTPPTGAEPAGRGVLGGGPRAPPAPGPGRRPAVRLRPADRRHRRHPRLHRGHRQAAPEPGPSRTRGQPRRHGGGGVMSLDHLAGAATRELLEQLPPDADRMLDDLKRTRRRRNVARSAAALAAVCPRRRDDLLAHRGDDTPDPAPDPRNGAIVAPPDNSAGAWRATSPTFGARAPPAAGRRTVRIGAVHRRWLRLVYPGPRRTIRAVDVTTGETHGRWGAAWTTVLPAACPPTAPGWRTAPRSTSRSRPSTPGTPSRSSPPGWSHRHARLVARRARHRVHAARVASTRSTSSRARSARSHRYASRRARTSSAPSWSPDGRTIAFLDQRPRAGTRSTSLVHRDDRAARTARACARCTTPATAPASACRRRP